MSNNNNNNSFIDHAENNNNNNNNSNQYKDEDGNIREFDQNELREVALTRAAARFGRLFLRDPTTLVDRKLLRQLITAIRTTAGMGHRSSFVDRLMGSSTRR